MPACFACERQLIHVSRRAGRLFPSMQNSCKEPHPPHLAPEDAGTAHKGGHGEPSGTNWNYDESLYPIGRVVRAVINSSPGVRRSAAVRHDGIHAISSARSPRIPLV